MSVQSDSGDYGYQYQKKTPNRMSIKFINSPQVESASPIWKQSVSGNNSPVAGDQFPSICLFQLSFFSNNFPVLTTLGGCSGLRKIYHLSYFWHPYLWILQMTVIPGKHTGNKDRLSLYQVCCPLHFLRFQHNFGIPRGFQVNKNG